MTDKELKKLSKTDLLSLLLTQSKEIDRLKEELAETKRLLEDRNIIIEKSGSLADASLAIFRVLDDAQKAADLSLENIKSGHFEKDDDSVEEGQDKETEESEADSQNDTELKKESDQYAGNAWCSHFRQSTKPQQKGEESR